MVGQTISHYKVIEKLGEGGMGVVYKAEDTKLRRIIALKFLPTKDLEGEEAKARFLREAQAAAALNHPNIATVYEIDEAEGKPFIALEYIDGGSLKEKAAGNPLKLEEALDTAIQAGEGLRAAQEAGITHRDIKSANIMLTLAGQVKIMDFGLAQLGDRSQLTKSGSALGTPLYMSPEQALGKGVDRRSDIWSLGVVLYEMVSGQLPFQGEVEAAVTYSIINEEPEPLTGLRSRLPIELDRIVAKALAKDPGERYQHVEELVVDLQALRTSLVPDKKTHPGRVAARATETRRNLGLKQSYVYAGTAAVVLVLLAALIWNWDTTGSRTTPSRAVEGGVRPSIAVMPFLNRSPDPDTDYFSDGMTDELINALSRLEGLRVVARSSVFRFKGKDYDIQQVGDALNVSTLLEGTVRKAGNRLRITAQLVNVENGFELWSDRFETEMRDVFDIQDEVCRAMVEALQVRLTGRPGGRLVERYTENLSAYNLYLRGRYHLRRLTPADFRKSAEYFAQARKADPSYPLPYAGLARLHSVRASYGVTPPKPALTKAEKAVSRGLALNDSIAELHFALGTVSMYRRDWATALSASQRAIELAPNSSAIRQNYARVLFYLGRSEESIEQARKAVELDPLDPLAHATLAHALFYARRYGETTERARIGIESDPYFPFTYVFLALSLVMQERWDEAVDTVERMGSLAGGDPMTESVAGLVYGLAGRRQKAESILAELLKRRKESHAPAYAIAVLHRGLGDTDRALDWLETSYQEGDPFLNNLREGPIWDAYRSHPRFQEVARKVNSFGELQ